MNLLARYRVDVACGVGLSLFAAALALQVNEQVRRSGSSPAFYQEEFAPAVMLACGQGFRNVDWMNRDPALAAFLQQRRDTLRCGELAKLPTVPRDSFQTISLYLQLAVALTWRVAGVSWGAVTWITALLAGFFAATVYGVLRLGMRAVAAAILSVVIVTSPLHLTYLPELRDYSKAPFLLALVLLMGVAVKWALPWRRLLCLAGLGGVIGGVGFGFRTDTLLAVAPFLAVLLVFRAPSPWIRSRSQVIASATAVAVFVGSFALAAAPVLRGRGNLGHVMLLGFSSAFNGALGVEAKHYELSARYHDVFQATVVRSFANRVGLPQSGSGAAEEYERESRRYLLAVIRTFPADIAIRAISGIGQILEAPFSPRYTRATGWVRSGLISRLYDWRADALNHLRWLGWAAGAAFIAGIAAWRIRCAVFLLCLIVFLGGAAAIQFHPRHFFYLEFMSWWAVGAILDGAVAARGTGRRFIGDSTWQSREWLAQAGVGVARSAALVVVCVVATAILLRTTRHYQQQGVNRLFERALSSAGPPLIVTSAPAGADRVTLTPDLPELELAGTSPTARPVGTAYLLIDVDPDRCDSLSFLAIAQYKALPGHGVSGLGAISLTDPRPGSLVKMLLPVYSELSAGATSIRFGGIELARGDAGCIAAIRKVGDVGSLPVLVTAVLGPDWRTATHYQTITGVETREDGSPFHVRVYLTLPTLEVGRSAIVQPPTNPWPGAVFTARVTAPVASGMVVDGRPETSAAYLLQYRERAISRGTCAVASGDLVAGGLTFGMLRNGLWYQQVNVTEPGRFIAAGCALEDGNYSLVLANNNPAGGVTTARLETIGWVGVGPQVLHTFPTELATTAAQFRRTTAILQQTDFRFKADVARVDPSGWRISGTADGPFSYLLVSKPQLVTDDRLLTVDGSIIRGGLAIGLLRDGRWAAQVNVTNLGAFAVLIQPPGGGTYDVIVANNLSDRARETDVTISRIAWVTR